MNGSPPPLSTTCETTRVAVTSSVITASGIVVMTPRLAFDSASNSDDRPLRPASSLKLKALSDESARAWAARLCADRTESTVSVSGTVTTASHEKMWPPVRVSWHAGEREMATASLPRASLASLITVRRYERSSLSLSVIVISWLHEKPVAATSTKTMEVTASTLLRPAPNAWSLSSTNRSTSALSTIPSNWAGNPDPP